MKLLYSLPYILFFTVPSVLSAVLTDKRTDEFARDPALKELAAADSSLATRGDEEAPKLYARVDVGLPPSKWVTVPIACATCIIACMTTSTGVQYVAGQTIHSVSVWREIGVCAVNCVFQGKCTSAEGGTWQAKQPHDFPLDS